MLTWHRIEKEGEYYRVLIGNNSGGLDEPRSWTQTGVLANSPEEAIQSIGLPKEGEGWRIEYWNDEEN